MRISGSILITAAFVSAMLVLQESSATAQTQSCEEQASCDRVCGLQGGYGYYTPALCAQCQQKAPAQVRKCKQLRNTNSSLNKPGGSTLGTNTPPKSKQPPIKPVSVGGANTDNNNQSGGRSDTQRTGGGSKH